MGTTDFRPLTNSTSLADCQKIVTGDYVDDSYPKTKFGANPDLTL